VGSLYKESVKKNGLFVTLKMVLYVLYSYPHFLYRIIKDRPDVVQVFPSSYWSYWRNWLYILLARMFGRKTIFHLLNAIDLFYGRVGAFQKWLLRISFKSADAYIVQSQGLQNWLEQYCQKPCYGFVNGIHLDRIPSECSLPPAISELPRPIGITIGPLGKHKGTPLILDVMSRLQRKGIDIGWVFIGRGEVADYRRRAQELQLSDRVVFPGPVTDDVKWQYLKHADFYCLPSDAEGQPISILEAMAVGLPVIATAVGSIPEIIADGETGFIIPVGDTDALEGAILEMLADGRRTVMGLAAQRYLAQHHDIQHLFDRLNEVYHTLSIE
jgi:glycosyltransferase involved in cell wall biosynthesis